MIQVFVSIPLLLTYCPLSASRDLEILHVPKMTYVLFSDPVVLDGKKKLRYLKLPCCYLLTMQIYYRGDFGRLGHGNSSDLFTPQPIKALQGLKIKQIACGDSHCLAVTMDGEVKRSVT